MIDEKKLPIEFTAKNELPFIQQNKESSYVRKTKIEKKSTASIMALKESERIRKQFKNIEKIIRSVDRYGNSSGNLLQSNKIESKQSSLTHEKYPIIKKSHTQSQHTEISPFSDASQIISFYKKKQQIKGLYNHKIIRQLKPLSTYLTKKSQVDYLSIQKAKISQKRVHTQRNIDVILDTRIAKVQTYTEEAEFPLDTKSKFNSLIQRKTQSHKAVNNSEIKLKQNAIHLKRQFRPPYSTYYYRDLLWKVNYSNELHIETPIEYEHRMKVHIGKGNNSGLIRGLINRRIWFAVVQRIQDANFIWTQLKVLSYFDLQKPKIREIEPKEDEYCSKGLLTENQSKSTKSYFEMCRNLEEKTDEKLSNRMKYLHQGITKIIKSNEIKETRMHNHLRNNYVIGNKKALLKAMAIYYKKNDENVFNYLPLTFHIEKGLEDDVYLKFLRHYYQRSKEIRKNNEDAENIWIVKPGQNSNRGYGIRVCKTLDEIKAIIRERTKCFDGTNRTYIVQFYIERPLLYHKRKFDLRHYMMITCVNGILKGYWYRQGYVRTSASEYTLKNKDIRIHLTNDAIQKQMPEYGKHEKGNKITYQQLTKYLLKHYRFNFKEIILPKMKKITTDIVKACSGSIDPDFRENNFQIFGLDFMIDANFNVWLIEVNTNPCLQISCPLLGGIIPKMIENALQLTLDAMFPPPIRYSPKGLHYSKKLEQENKFDLIYDSRIDGVVSSSGLIDPQLLEDEDETFEDEGEYWDED